MTAAGSLAALLPGAALRRRQRAAAAQPVALGHVHERRHRREGGDDRPGLRLAGDMDGVAGKDHRARAARVAAEEALGLLESDTDACRGRACERRRSDAVAQIIQSAAREAACPATIIDDGFKERIALRLERVEAAMSRRIARGTGVLATIGATAPFVGLFGTVWGIMNSFIGISEAQTTNLAVVAPGIAEALLATALGLVAAIPAVVIYNHLARVDRRLSRAARPTPRRRCCCWSAASASAAPSRCRGRRSRPWARDLATQLGARARRRRSRRSRTRSTSRRSST